MFALGFRKIQYLQPPSLPCPALALALALGLALALALGLALALALALGLALALALALAALAQAKPCPALPCPALPALPCRPCPALPCPALPCGRIACWKPFFLPAHAARTISAVLCLVEGKQRARKPPLNPNSYCWSGTTCWRKRAISGRKEAHPPRAYCYTP